jgi:glutaredoxin-related protein
VASGATSYFGRRPGDELWLQADNGVRPHYLDAAMSRPILEEDRIHAAIREKVATDRTDIVREVQAAIAANDVVIVGMAQNPAPRKARKALDAAGIPYKYLEYGSYLGEWRRRTALKMWTGWQTFPMIFVKGTFVGGASDLAKLMESGELNRMLGK